MQDFARNPEEGLTQKQIDAIFALINQATIRDAAKAVEVDESTLYRWLQNPAFRDAYANMRHEIVRQAIAQAQKATNEARIFNHSRQGGKRR